MKINGIKVVDATKKLHISIEPRDVKSGMAKGPAHCAAAKAAVREVPGCTAARVHLSRTYLKIGEKEWIRYKTPGALRGEIISFDRGGKFEPGDYILTPLSANQRERHGKRQGSKPRFKKGRPGRTRAAYHVIHGVRNRHVGG